MTPEHLGKYRLVSKIADGGMAEVFVAVTAGLGGFQKRVALKKILSSFSRDESFVHSFVNEARICGQLHHPNLVQVYEFERIDDSLCLAMEFIEGLDLERIINHRLLKRALIPAPVAVEIVLQMLDGLEYAHTARSMDNEPLNVVHRDLKPSNVLIDRSGVIKIVDFGVAKASTNRYKTIHAGTAKGTVSYMSPEQASGRMDLGPASDVFSVAAILYELLTLRRLFDGENLFAILDEVRTAPLEPRFARLPEVPPGLVAALTRGLTRELPGRYHSAQEMARDLRSIFPGEGGPQSLVRFVDQLVGEGLEILGLSNEQEATPSNPLSWSQLPRVMEEAPVPPRTPAAAPRRVGEAAQEITEWSSRKKAETVGSLDFGGTQDIDPQGIPRAQVARLDFGPTPTGAVPMRPGLERGLPSEPARPRDPRPAPPAQVPNLAAPRGGMELPPPPREAARQAPNENPDLTATPPSPLSPRGLPQPPQPVTARSPAHDPWAGPPDPATVPHPLGPGRAPLARGNDDPTRTISRAELSPALQAAAMSGTFPPPFPGPAPAAGASLGGVHPASLHAPPGPGGQPPGPHPVSGASLGGVHPSQLPGPVPYPPPPSSFSAGPAPSAPAPHPAALEPSHAHAPIFGGPGPQPHGQPVPTAFQPNQPVFPGSVGLTSPLPPAPSPSDASGTAPGTPPMARAADAPEDFSGSWAMHLGASNPATTPPMDPNATARWADPSPQAPVQVESLFNRSTDWSSQESTRPFGAPLSRVVPEAPSPAQGPGSRRQLKLLLVMLILLSLPVAGAVGWTLLGLEPSLKSLLSGPQAVVVTLRVKQVPSWGEPSFFGDPTPIKLNEGEYQVTLTGPVAYRLEIVGRSYHSTVPMLVTVDPADPATWEISCERDWKPVGGK